MHKLIHSDTIFPRKNLC